jgi:hypothetical protein
MSLLCSLQYAPAPAPASATGGGAAQAPTFDVGPDQFAGVSVEAHKAALCRMYRRLKPESLPLVDALWAQFGVRVWAALARKYPEVGMAKVMCPLCAFASSVPPCHAYSVFVTACLSLPLSVPLILRGLRTVGLRIH